MAHAKGKRVRQNTPLIRNVQPWISLPIGAAVSVLLGTAAGRLLESVSISWIGADPKWSYIAFWPIFGAVAGAVFASGLGKRITTAHEGVPELFGRRLWFFTLSEGLQWLPDAVMSWKEVDTSLTTNNGKDGSPDPISVTALSKDGVLMSALIIAQYQVDDPAQNLSANGPINSLLAMAESQVRSVFAQHTSAELTQADVKSKLGTKIKDAADEHDYKYGFEVLEIFEPEVLPPVEITNALAKARTEEAEAVAEEIELRKVRERVAELKADGLSPELAYEVVQTERGKLTGTRTIHRIEGLKGVADSLGAAIAGAFGKSN